VSGGESYWIASTESPGYARLDGDLSVDVAVVGGGIAGLTTALLLKQSGLRVAVLEAAEVGAGVTGHTTGKLTAGQALRYSGLEETHGREAASIYATSQTAAIELVFRLAESLAIDCDLERTSNYVYAETSDEVALLEREHAAARRAGLAVELEKRPNPPFPALAAIRLGGQGQLHARKYTLGLARAVHGDGSVVAEHSRVVAVEPGMPMRLDVQAGHVTAGHVVVATNAPITSSGLFFGRIHPRRGYALAAPLTGEPVSGMWINVGSPTRSVRTAPSPEGGRLVIVVGEAHRVGHAGGPASHEALSWFLGRHFDAAEPVYRWSTQDQYSVDGVPYIGRVGGSESRLYVATGFGGWGLTNGTLAGLLLADAVAGRRNEWADPFDPGRSSLRRAPVKLVRENANVARQLLAGRLQRRPGSIAGVAPGTGEVVKVEGEPVAVYRDRAGGVDAVSAVCTHMGCVVAWNAVERTWDCPCHGSRFETNGTVIDGPATRPLEPVDVEAPTPT
jgi:glycine/D-amino acid oxidase-like deaminating enzyme/nitrite reductase/ring-hydroxylating ferredoxin subunit